VVCAIVSRVAHVPSVCEHVAAAQLLESLVGSRMLAVGMSEARLALATSQTHSHAMLSPVKMLRCSKQEKCYCNTLVRHAHYLARTRSAMLFEALFESCSSDQSTTIAVTAALSVYSTTTCPYNNGVVVHCVAIGFK
jgi:hypothetical protein